MKKDINTLIESFFAKKEGVINVSMLEEMVKNRFNTILKEESYPQMANKKSLRGYNVSGGSGAGKTTKEFTVKYSFIPEISVSELGWSSLKTVDGVPVSSPQRQQLFDYLKNIKGDTLAEKVRSINAFYKKTPEQLEADGFFSKESKSSKIQQIISYLVFLKTLTTIITNFNARSAGFAFESFLGVLLEGAQVATNSGTIADLTTGGKMGKMGISLKLYSESSLTVDGSFTDLCNDMINPKHPENPFIRYIIALKTLQGEGMDLNGEITIYQFDISLDNIFNVLSRAGKHSKECIRLPKLFINSKGKSDFSHLKQKERTGQEILAFFEKRLSDTFQSSEFSKRFVDWSKILIKSHETIGFWTGGEKGGLGKTTPDVNKLKNLIKNFVTQDIIQQEHSKDFLERLKIIYKDTVNYAKGADLPAPLSTEAAERLYNILTEGKPKAPKKEEVAYLAEGVELASLEDSVKFYNSASKEMKKKALINTQGYVKTMQFSMAKGQLFEVIGSTGQEESGPIATIQVGVANVENIINKLASAMNQEVFEIFDNLSLLTSNINSYFATGLKDDNAADAAQAAALNIDKKTEKIQTQSKT